MNTVSAGPIRVLHVDDDPAFADLTATALERENDRLAVETAASADEGLVRLGADEPAFDCVVSDHDMPGRSGIGFLEAVRADHPDLPFVLFTGKGSEEVASEAISAGVTEYMHKETGTDRFAVLANRITNAVDHARSRRTAERGERRLREVVDAIPHPVYVVDADGTYRLVNRALAAFHDADVADVEGASVDDVLDDATARRFRAHVGQVLDTGEPVVGMETESVDADGERRAFEPRLFPFESTASGERAVLGVATDVTDRVDRERSAERTRERLRLALDHTDSVVIDVDLDTGEVSRHGTYERVFDYQPEALPTWQDHCESVVHPDDRAAFRRLHHDLIDGTRETGRIEYRIASGADDPRWRRAAVQIVDSPDVEGRRAIGISRDVTADKRSEAELRRKERRYQSIFDDPNVLLGLVDTDGTALDVNRTAMGYIDADREAVIGERLWETPWFARSDSDPAAVREWVAAAADGEYVEFDLELPRPDGEPCVVEGVFRPVTDDDGEVVSVIVSARETTDQRRHERDLERANALLSTLFDTMPVGVLAEGGDRTVLAANRRFVDHFDVPATPDELVGADCARLAAEAAGAFADPEGFEARIDRLIADGDVVRDEELTLRDGRTFTRSHHPIDLPDGDGDGHLWVYRDVTDRRTYERRLEAVNGTTQRLMGAETRDDVARIAVEAAREVLGLDADSLHFHDDEREALVPAAQTDVANDLVGDPPAFAGGDGIAWRAYRRGESLAVDDVHEEVDVYNPDSPVRSELYLPVGDEGLLIAASTTPGEFGGQDVVLGEILAGNVATALDQVDRTAELRAREAELTRQNDRLEGFASVVSHDLRNPLNVAEGRLAMAREETDTPHLAPVARALDRMGTLIDDLLTLAREGEAVRETEPVPLAPLVRDCWGTVETADATLAVDADRTVRADRSRLRQLFENLIRNAVEHGGPEVCVEVGDLPDADGFYVADDGPGIPPAEREAVFDVGFSTARDGTGFGLSIVRQVVDAHGWAIAVVEGDDGGARFEVTGVAAVADGAAAAR